MYVIGERINGMFKDVRKAIQECNTEIVQNLAKAQLEAGANALDVNVGPAAADATEAMVWLVQTIRQVTQAPLAIDTTKPEVMEAGLAEAGAGSIINSTTGQEEKLTVFMPMAQKHKAAIIALTIDEKGIPRDAAGRTEIALRIVASAFENGIEDMQRLFIDPVILPVNVAQTVPQQVMDALREVRLLSDPPPKTVLGLSNVSQGTALRSLINRTYLVMAIAAGLDGAILDPMDEELMNAGITAELLLDKQVYCDDYLKAYLSSVKSG
ncbi:MAG: dihydropteroate synthase [Armatimonadetes bacterium]|nr:dihydropteroate synthase [Armatimonadota bacterium]NIM23565.1 dihydropteroate synthase [Armatimonadota bacterium]NIM67431.1 dihydropteroate synthase [Armatimonadota bacterium]NIM75932.1 dihydropteroate synthase [Armatimonadota bacterium]NIN05617.1 dihydropteroate synthase [Armatimonadota bacterium]